MFHWICLLLNLLVLVGVELPLCILVTLTWNALTCFWSQVEYKIVPFYLCVVTGLKIILSEILGMICYLYQVYLSFVYQKDTFI